MNISNKEVYDLIKTEGKAKVTNNSDVSKDEMKRFCKECDVPADLTDKLISACKQ
jgi:hypothetical protein